MIMTNTIADRGRVANGARETNGVRPAVMHIEVTATAFKPYAKNTLIGFVDLMLPSIGLTISGCTVHEKGESRWIGLPGRPYTENGVTKYANILDFPDKDARA